MNSADKTASALEDFKVPVKLKISALWTTVMFCYVYGDIFVLQQPGHLQELIDGTVWYGGPLTQGLLLSFAIGMAIPSVMIFLTLALKPTINRWTNIVLGAICALGPILTMRGAWHFYIFLGVIEVVLMLLIVWYAWKWPRQTAARI